MCTLYLPCWLNYFTDSSMVILQYTLLQGEVILFVWSISFPLLVLTWILETRWVSPLKVHTLYESSQLLNKPVNGKKNELLLVVDPNSLLIKYDIYYVHVKYDTSPFICIPSMLTELLYPFQDGDTPLHLATLGGHATCVERLLSTPGIDVNIKGKVSQFIQKLIDVAAWKI